MVSMSSTVFFLIGLIMLSPLAQAQILSGGLPIVGPLLQAILGFLLPSVNNLNASGALCCTATGSCPGPPLSGVRVNLTCTNILGTSVVVGQGTTGVNGRFNITVPGILGIVPSLIPIPCRVSVALPINQTVCAVLSRVNGTLTGVLTPVQLLVGGVLGGVGGLVGNLLQLVLSAVTITF